jgi:hypothetical protein
LQFDTKNPCFFRSRDFFMSYLLGGQCETQ